MRSKATSSPDLREIINEMDMRAQTSLGQIEAIANLALRFLEQPAGHQCSEHLAIALEAIESLSALAASEIADYATGGGAAYVDARRIARLEAYAKAEEQRRG